MKKHLNILTSNNIPSLLLTSDSAHGILLLQEAVYLLHNPLPSQLKNCQVYVLEEDLVARGLNNSIAPQTIRLVNYHNFVDLIIEYTSNITWK